MPQLDPALIRTPIPYCQNHSDDSWCSPWACASCSTWRRWILHLPFLAMSRWCLAARSILVPSASWPMIRHGFRKPCFTWIRCPSMAQHTSTPASIKSFSNGRLLHTRQAHLTPSGVIASASADHEFSCGSNMQSLFRLRPRRCLSWSLRNRSMTCSPPFMKGGRRKL